MAQLDSVLSQGGQPVEELVKFENPRFGKETTGHRRNWHHLPEDIRSRSDDIRGRHR